MMKFRNYPAFCYQVIVVLLPESKKKSSEVSPWNKVIGLVLHVTWGQDRLYLTGRSRWRMPR